MKILIVADGRSPITRNWIRMLQPLGYRLWLVSSYPCQPVPGVEEIHILPLAFARFAGSQAGSGKSAGKPGLISRMRKPAATLRHWLGPLTVASHKQVYLELLDKIDPDLVHALRIPYEGMLALNTPASTPLVVSTWGNDLTLHAPSTRGMASLTRKVLSRADALMSDTRRDINLARDWGFDPTKPALAVPGNGGIDLVVISAATKGVERSVPPQVLNPRGMRSYVRTDTFFKSIPLVLEARPEVHFTATSMAGQAEALDWIGKLNLQERVTLLPLLSQAELWREFARSTLSISVTSHDGTPNTLLEAMALGCFPVCGDLESIREWIAHGENGLLVDPTDPRALADAVLTALKDRGLLERAACQNAAIVRERAEISTIRLKVAGFYRDLAGV